MRQTRAQIELDVRQQLAAQGVPCMWPVHDEGPRFDRYHEALITSVVDTLDALWASYEEMCIELKLPLTAEPDLFKTWNHYKLDRIVDERFDLSDVDPYEDLGGES